VGVYRNFRFANRESGGPKGCESTCFPSLMDATSALEQKS
jgi:hypothetical protein